MGKLKVLCLHGYRQNETIFRERTGALRKLLKREIEFIFVSAPHIIPEPDNLVYPPDLQERGWFFSRPERAYKGIDQTDICIGLEESLHFLEQVFKENGPFDGILGFSQGACLIGLLCAQYHSDMNSPFRFQFVMLFSGFKSLLSPHSNIYTNPLQWPSFHTIGDTDEVIPSHMSTDLAGLFANAILYHHKGGHYIPASPDLRRALQDFLRPFLD